MPSVTCSRSANFSHLLAIRSLPPLPPHPSPFTSIPRPAIDVFLTDDYQITSFSIKSNSNFTIDEYGTAVFSLARIEAHDYIIATLEIIPLNRGNFLTRTTSRAVQYNYFVKQARGQEDVAAAATTRNADDVKECNGAMSIDSLPRNALSQEQWAAKRISAPSPAQVSIAFTCLIALIIISYRSAAHANKFNKPGAWREAQLVSFFIGGLFVTLVIAFTIKEIMR